MEKCPYCKIPLRIVALREYLPVHETEAWVFWCDQCRHYFAAPTDEQVRQFLQEPQPHDVLTASSLLDGAR